MERRHAVDHSGDRTSIGLYFAKKPVHMPWKGLVLPGFFEKMFKFLGVSTFARAMNTMDRDIRGGGMPPKTSPYMSESKIMAKLLNERLKQAANAFEQERNERRVVLSRELGENALELAPVVGAEIWRHLHSSEDDFHLGIFRLRFVDDRLEIFLHRFQFEPAQAVVRAQLDDKNVDGTLEQPINSAQPTRAGVAAQTRVLNFERQTGRANFFRD